MFPPTTISNFSIGCFDSKQNEWMTGDEGVFVWGATDNWHASKRFLSLYPPVKSTPLSLLKVVARAPLSVWKLERKASSLFVCLTASRDPFYLHQRHAGQWIVNIVLIFNLGWYLLPSNVALERHFLDFLDGFDSNSKHYLGHPQFEVQQSFRNILPQMAEKIEDDRT